MMHYPVVPAIIPRSLAEAITFTDTLRFSPELHFDVVDGHFVPDISWPYEPAGEPLEVKTYTDRFTLEVDLMVADPIPAAKAWLAAGADMLVFHAETVSAADLEAFVDSTQVSIGISVHGNTPLSVLTPYVPFVDYIQLMGIFQIGSQGQPFRESILTELPELKAQYPDLLVSVDGSVNRNTITRLQKAGADRFIVGSAIVGQSDQKAAYHELTHLINS